MALLTASPTGFYSASAALVASASNNTDVLTFTMAGTKVAQLMSVSVSGFSSITALGASVSTVLRSSGPTGGTPVAVTALSHDATNPASAATVNAYTSAPTVGNAIGTLVSQVLTLPLLGTSPGNLTISWPLGAGPLVASGTWLCVNVGAVGLSGGNLRINLTWAESYPIG